MEKFQKFMLLAAVVLFTTVSSCSSDDDGGGGGQAAQGTITAKIDGVSFTSLEMTSFASVTTAGGQTTLVMQGNTSSQAINIVINGYDGEGTYELSDNNVFRTASYIEPNVNNPVDTQTWTAPYENSGLAGEINISEETETAVKGTFSFTGKNSNDDSIKTITEGSFNLEKM
ncbi:MAG TPA: DUF6252 family protein [Flavobacteriaceae bacterium]|nr:DUF6252 family protein [Flavobacteriaceae bacterium]